MAIMGGKVTKKIFSYVGLYGSIMQQYVIENNFNLEYALLSSINFGVEIKNTVKCLNNLYLDLNNSHLHVLSKITNAGETYFDTNIAFIKMTLHWIFSETAVKFNCQNVG